MAAHSGWWQADSFGKGWYVALAASPMQGLQRGAYQMPSLVSRLQFRIRSCVGQNLGIQVLSAVNYKKTVFVEHGQALIGCKKNLYRSSFVDHP